MSRTTRCLCTCVLVALGSRLPAQRVQLPVIERVEPPLAVTFGGTQVTLIGRNLPTIRGGVRGEVGRQVRVGGVPMTDVVWGDSTRIPGRTPRLVPGFYDVDILFEGRIEVVLRRAIEVAPPPSLLRVVPGEVYDGLPVTITGRELRPGIRIFFGDHEVALDPPAVDWLSVTGVTPPLAPGEALGTRTVSVFDHRGTTRLDNGVTYVEPPSGIPIPGPQQIETSLAEGTARYRWCNMIAYERIVVTDDAGRRIAELPGDTTFYEMPSGGRTQVKIDLTGEVSAGLFSDPSRAIAALHQCSRPPPLTVDGVPGDINFYLRGDHAEAQIARCENGGGGGAGHDVPINGGGAASFAGATGLVTTELDKSIFRTADLLQARGNKIVTGFELPTPSDRLEFAVHMEKLATDFGLDLRGRLIHVMPNSGFEDEFTFPNVRIGEGKNWNCVTYFRAKDDVINPETEPCGLQIPAGQYLLELYAVGGDEKLPYYVVSDSGRPNELLIPGVPCPPYPAVRVTDLTGVRTLPDITEICLKVIQPPGDLFQLTVQLTARGKWFDENNVSHSIDPDGENYIDAPHFEYLWTIHDKVPPSCYPSSGNVIYPLLPDWGCYKIDLTVRDKRCGSSKTRSFELPMYPQPPRCPEAPFFSFLCPTPDPGGVYGLVGLHDPPVIDTGSYSGERPVEFRILVSPSCACAGGASDSDGCPSDRGRGGGVFPGCPAPRYNDTVQDFQIRLATPSILLGEGDPNCGPFSIPLDVDIKVIDLCENVDEGPKFFLIRINDLSQIPRQAALGEKIFRPVFFQGRQNGDGCWHNIGANFWLGNRPQALETTYWNGHFVPEDESYHFVLKSADDTEQDFDIGPSNEIELIGGAKLESKQNDLSSGFTSRIMTVGGVWCPEKAPGTMSGMVMSNDMSGAPLEVEPDCIGCPGQGAGDGSGAILNSDLPRYEWCDRQQIVNERFSSKIFEAILYTGTIGPVPVTIWASIGFGLEVMIDSYISVFFTPFSPLEEGNGDFLQTHFYLTSKVDLEIPCEVRADILGGVGSIAVRLIPAVNFRLDAHLRTIDTDFFANLFLQAVLNLTMEVEACINLLLAELCVGVDIPLIEGEPLIPQQGCDPLPLVTCANPDHPGGDDGCAEAIIGGGAADGGGSGIIDFPPSYQVVSAPAIATSPDESTLVTVSFDSNGRGHVAIDGSDVDVSDTIGGFLDPSAAFLTNDLVLVAYTEGFCPESSVPQFCQDPTLEPTLDDHNEVAAQQEVVLRAYEYNGFAWESIQPPGLPLRIADPLGSPAETKRVDGRISLAADRSSEAVQAGGEALAAWVRYTTRDFLINDGTTTQIFQPTGTGDQRAFLPQEVPTVRPQMEKTAIFSRRLGASAAFGSLVEISAATPGINVEPRIALAPSGQAGYCVWVHDPTHGDLINNNRGRFLKYSVYEKATDTWSAPGDVLPIPDDYPGLLEPFVNLKDDQNGIVAFTALEKTATVRDTGLGGGSRFVFVTYLEDGLFSEPVRIHGKCQRQEYGHWVEIHADIPNAIDFADVFLKGPKPEWVMVYQGKGPIGHPTGSGDVMVSALGQGMTEWTPPVTITPDDNIHSNISATLARGVLCTLNLNGGLAKLSAVRGAGIERERTFDFTETRLEPDLHLAGCTLSDPFSSPGSRVTATVSIENLGLAGTPFDDSGESATGLEAVFIEDNGDRRVVASVALPILQPMQTHEVMLELEMPHEPVELRVQFSPNPVDRDRTNDSRQCFFGTPKPREFTCQSIRADNESAAPAVLLTWENAAVYDEIILYRDDVVLTVLPGRCTMLVDHYAELGDHEYAVRGRLGVSKSSRATCQITHIAPEVPVPTFRRGDVNGDGELVITDPVAFLGFLFLGAEPPTCFKAADTNDTGELDLTDGVYTLNFLFNGGPVPPEPFTDCGEDPTEDTLTCGGQEGC